jgi:PelA/Pel-15E family pectate lyase
VSRKDVVAVPDPEAPPLWARFYEIGTNRPFMANRDGTKVYSIEELEHERRSGYAWYGTGPALLLEEYASWKKPQTICSEARECVEN